LIRRRMRVIDAMINAAEYIGRDSPASADRFLNAVESTFAHLEAFPGSGHPHESDEPKLAGVRVWSVKGFRNYLIFYRPFDGGVEIIHLLHGARDIGPALAKDLGF
jgi:toxin ParE1/3/4